MFITIRDTSARCDADMAWSAFTVVKYDLRRPIHARMRCTGQRRSYLVIVGDYIQRFAALTSGKPLNVISNSDVISTSQLTAKIVITDTIRVAFDSTALGPFDNPHHVGCTAA